MPVTWSRQEAASTFTDGKVGTGTTLGVAINRLDTSRVDAICPL